MARETINGISVAVPGAGEPADFQGARSAITPLEWFALAFSCVASAFCLLDVFKGGRLAWWQFGPFIGLLLVGTAVTLRGDRRVWRRGRN